MAPCESRSSESRFGPWFREHYNDQETRISKNLNQKHTLHFIEYDVKDFYPSITEDLLDKAMEWADKVVGLSDNDKEIIRQTKKSLLYSDKQPWTKKGETPFDVAMGSYDGAETCDLVGLYLLSLLQDLPINVGWPCVTSPRGRWS